MSHQFLEKVLEDPKKIIDQGGYTALENIIIVLNFFQIIHSLEILLGRFVLRFLGAFFRSSKIKSFKIWNNLERKYGKT